MNNLTSFFSTDWEAMTHADWTGLIIVIVLTALMIGLYTWVFKPSNRDHFEQHRDFVNDPDFINDHNIANNHNQDMNREAGHGQAK